MADLLQIDKNHVNWSGVIMPCVVGRSGFSNDKYEGDGFTPTGKWKPLTVYYRADRVKVPKSNLPIIAINPNSGWSDDPKDSLYNQEISLPSKFSHEKLWREDNLYDLFITIDHNTNPVVKGRGSAIFIHQMHESETPTAGCLALKFSDLERLVSEITQDTCWIIGEHLA